jgi:hypothetical protein
MIYYFKHLLFWIKTNTKKHGTSVGPWYRKTDNQGLYYVQQKPLTNALYSNTRIFNQSTNKVPTIINKNLMDKNSICRELSTTTIPSIQWGFQ